MSLKTNTSIPVGVKDGVAVTAVAQPLHQVATPTSCTLSVGPRCANVGGPLRSSSENSSFQRCRSTSERSHSATAAAAATSTAAAARATSPSYRHNPYLASPASEVNLYLASPESGGLDVVNWRRSVCSSNNSRSVDVTSDRRLVVRSRSSRRGMSSPARSISGSGGGGDTHDDRGRARNLSPAFMNPLEDQLMEAEETQRCQPRQHPHHHHYHDRCDSIASLSCDSSPYSVVLYSCIDSSSASLGQVSSFLCVPASPLASSTHTRRRMESPSNRHGALNDHSRSHGSPETSSLYYSFGNHSASTVVSTSNNPYVGVSITPENPAPLAGAQDGVSPCSTTLPLRHPTVPRVSSSNSNNNSSASALRTATTESSPVRVARVNTSNSTPSATPRNSSGAAGLNTNESISIPSTYISPAAAVAAAATTTAGTTTTTVTAPVSSEAAASAPGPTNNRSANATRRTATPCSRSVETSPPYNLLSSAPLSPDTADMIVPPGHPVPRVQRQPHVHHYHHGADPSEVSTSSQDSGSAPHYPYQCTPRQQQRGSANSTQPPLFMPPSRAAYGMAANPTTPPPYLNSYSTISNDSGDSGGTQFIYVGSGASLPAATTTTTTATTSPPYGAAVTAVTMNNCLHEDHATAPPPAYDAFSLAVSPDQLDVLSDRAPPTQFTTIAATGSSLPTHHPQLHQSSTGSAVSQEDEEGITAGRLAQQRTEKNNSGTATTGTPRTDSNLLASLTSANGMTRTTAGLPDMLSGGPTMSLASDEEATTASAPATPAVVGQATEGVAVLPKVTRMEEGRALHGARGSAAAGAATRATTTTSAADLEEEEEEGVESDDDDGSAAARTTFTTATGAAAADGKKAKNKKKRARRNRKRKFLEDLPPATEMKFLPPPPPPLPASYDGSGAAMSTEPRFSFDKYYQVLLRWYERILADEADFVGVNCTPAAQPSGNPNINVAGASAGSLEASHATLQNSDVSQSSGNHVADSAMFTLTSLNVAGSNAAGLHATSPNPATARVRRMAGGGEVPVLCPRIEQYMPICDIPSSLVKSCAAVAVAAPYSDARRFSLLSGTSNAEGTAATQAGAKPASEGEEEKAMDSPGAKLLHVQHVGRAVQWANDLMSWWLCYVHPHSFNSRRQRIPQDFPLPVAAGTTTPAFTQVHPSSNTDSVCNWTPSSMVMTSYESGRGQPYHSSSFGTTSSGNVGMSVMSGSVSVAAGAAPEHAYTGLPMSSYPTYAGHDMTAPPPPPPPHHHAYQPQMPPPSVMGVYTVYP
jgi:hypothetical protein